EVVAVPTAEAGLRIGRQVGSIDGAERRRNRAPACVGRAAARGVAAHAVADARQVFALRELLLAVGDGYRRLVEIGITVGQRQPECDCRDQHKNKGTDADEQALHGRASSACWPPHSSGRLAPAGRTAGWLSAGTVCAASHEATALMSAGL